MVCRELYNDDSNISAVEDKIETDNSDKKI